MRPNQLEALEKNKTRRAKVPYLRYGDGEMYLCDNEGCPKAGQPLSCDTNKNHRKNFKKYGACYKSLSIDQLSYQIKSKTGESVYPRKCPNPGCPLGDKLLTKCTFNLHKRSFEEYNVCNRRQLEKNRPVYPLPC